MRSVDRFSCEQDQASPDCVVIVTSHGCAVPGYHDPVTLVTVSTWYTPFR